MFDKLIQAAIITFLLHISYNTIHAKVTPSLGILSSSSVGSLLCLNQ